MKKIFLSIFIILIQNFVWGQKSFLDQAYLETSAKADTLVVPDRIYISINLNESDSKNKKSVEELEKLMEINLKKLNINTEKDLSLSDLSSNFKSYFLKGQNILKSKEYTLLVRDAITAGKVMVVLENAGISNLNITKTEYSKREEMILELKAKAIAKTKHTAQKLVQPLGQKIGKAIHIYDNTSSHHYNTEGRVMKTLVRGLVANSMPEPIPVEFQKIRLEAEVSVKYILE